MSWPNSGPERLTNSASAEPERTIILLPTRGRIRRLWSPTPPRKTVSTKGGALHRLERVTKLPSTDIATGRLADGRSYSGRLGATCHGGTPSRRGCLTSRGRPTPCNSYSSGFRYRLRRSGPFLRSGRVNRLSPEPSDRNRSTSRPEFQRAGPGDPGLTGGNRSWPAGRGGRGETRTEPRYRVRSERRAVASGLRRTRPCITVTEAATLRYCRYAAPYG